MQLPGSDLLPPGHNPAQAPVIVMHPSTREAIEVFDGPGEDRWYDWVDQLDGLTIGFGQWPQSEFCAFLKDLSVRGKAAAFPAFKRRLVEFYSTHPGSWAVTPGATGTPGNAEVDALLSRTLYNGGFMSRWARNCEKDVHQRCRKGSPSFFLEACDERNDWAGSAFRYALRDAAVVQWQVDYWQACLIDKAEKDASAIGLAGISGMVAMASMRSSAPTYVADFKRQVGTGTVTRGGHSWDWNHPAKGCTDLVSWRLLVAWQFYNTIKQRIRGRSQVFYDRYLASHWTLPDLKPSGRPDWHSVGNSDPTLVRWK